MPTPDDVNLAARLHTRKLDERNAIAVKLAGLPALNARAVALDAEMAQLKEVMAGRAEMPKPPAPPPFKPPAPKPTGPAPTLTRTPTVAPSGKVLTPKPTEPAPPAPTEPPPSPTT
jgi:anti-sigma factor RsiW